VFNSADCRPFAAKVQEVHSRLYSSNSALRSNFVAFFVIHCELSCGKTQTDGRMEPVAVPSLQSIPWT